MKKMTGLILLLTVLTACSAGLTSYPARQSKPLTFDRQRELIETDPIAPDTLEKLRRFASDTSSELLTGQANQMYSPISLYIALAMLAGGADGPTASELYQLLDQPIKPDELAWEMSRLSSRLNLKDEASRIKLANSIWNQAGLPFHKDYIERLTTDYQASLFEVDFSDPKTAGRLSKWVSDETEGLVQPEFKDLAETVSLLINTLYYRDRWLDKFDKSATRPDTFYGTQGEVSKDFMQKQSHMSYFNQTDIEGVALPLGMSRLILLKQAGTNPAGLMQAVDYKELIDTGQWREVKLALPKFSFDTSYELKPVLQKLGVVDVFDPDKADLSGISPLELFVSRIFQDSFIALDEDGIEAAAVTVVELAPTAAPPADEIIELRFDEPFLFIIENREGIPLFVGTLSH